MPNRVIKESIKRSPQIDSLTWFEEVVFYRLMVTADDYGCCDGRIVLLKNELFPTRDNVTRKSIEEAISKLTTVGLLCPYTVNDMPYLFFPTWEKHQRLRNKKRKFPEPPEYLTVKRRSNDGQMTADCQLEIELETESEYEPETELESESNPNPVRRQAADDAFDCFWAAYPRKVGKAYARKCFMKVRADIGTLLSAIEKQKTSVEWTKENGKYIPNPSTWLNQGRWEDELTINEYRTESWAELAARTERGGGCR